MPLQIEFEKKITISDIVIAIGLVGAMATGFYNANYRISANADAIQQIVPTLRVLGDGQVKQNQVLDKLNTQLDAFKLHRHVSTAEGDEIMYPNGDVEPPLARKLPKPK